MIRVVVTGSRYWDEGRLPEVLLALRRLRDRDPGAFVVLGDARGVDTLARRACETLCLDHAVLYARGRWPGAGPIRNRRMLDVGGPEAEVWYFHDDLDAAKGTRNCVEQARRRGLVVRNGLELEPPSNERTEP